MGIIINLGNIRSADVPAALTKLEVKRQLYSIDPFFREGWDHIRDSLGEEAAAALDNLTCIIFKPDAFAGRKVRQAIDWLHQYGFEPIAFAGFVYNRNSIREDWRYQYNIATGERIDLVDLLLMAGPSLMVVIRLADRKQGMTASEMLKQLKGPSQPHLRRSGHLRYELGIVSTFINFIHTTDESADIPRALSLYFSRPEREVLIRKIAAPADVSQELEQQIEEYYALIPEHDLNFYNSLERISETLEIQTRRWSKSEQEKISSAIAAMQQKLPDADSAGFFCRLREKGLEAALWDEIIVRAELVIPTLTGGEAIIL